MRRLAVDDFKENIFELIRQGALLSAGTVEAYNAMTIAWGTFGFLWGKNVATVYVRPFRYTHQFIKESPFFTITFFAPRYREDLAIMGSKSGRDMDKIAASSLHPTALSENIITFQEARITMVCRKIYEQPLDAAQLNSADISRYYDTADYHDAFIGEVIDIYVNESAN